MKDKEKTKEQLITELEGMRKQTARLEAAETERTQTEENLRSLLERERKLSRDIEEQIERNVHFTRAIVHELKSPLVPLLAATDYLANNLDGTFKEFADTANRSALRLERRVGELLGLAKGEVGLLELRCRQFDPLAMLRNVVEDMKPKAQKDEQSLELEAYGLPAQVWGDEERLQQVMFNLIDNAIKFNRRQGKILIKAEANNERLSISVKDDGCGIEQGEIPTIFMPYKRRKGITAGLGGLGIGLSLSKMLVELHGGEIRVESKKGQGSTFSFSIPLER